MNTRNISVVEPLEKAWNSMLTILFRPFDLGKWFTIAFCAFLAFLASGGGGGTGYHGGGKRRGESVAEGLGRARDYVVENLFWIVPLVMGVLLLALVVWLLFLWLSSRGHFMFLHCVALNRAEVALPWRVYSKEANSLFIFRAVLHLLLLVPIVLLLVMAGVALIPIADGRSAAPLGIAVLVAVALAAVAFIIVFWAISRLVEDFMVPAMAIRRSTSMPAWREVTSLVRMEPGAFGLYLLMRIVLALAAGAIIVVLVLVTCCIAGCILAIPYLGTVLLLPILVFQRSYSIHFLAQFGPDYDLTHAGDSTVPA